MGSIDNKMRYRRPSDARTACVVIHHRRPDVIGRTVGLITDNGVEPNDVLVVDNSESFEVSHQVELTLPEGVAIRQVENRGYGHAANIGIDHFLGRSEVPEFLLISTHEVIPEPRAIDHLIAAMDRDPKLVAVGPALESRNVSQGDDWVSYGGEFTPLLGLPKHSASADKEVSKRRWLDGAFVLYRSQALEGQRFREEFFLYFEETELQARLIRAGGDVAVVPLARVREDAHRVPAELEGRNLQWFLQLHGTRFQQTFTAPSRVVAKAARVALGRDGLTDLRSFISGWREARRAPLKQESLEEDGVAPEVTVLNPLGGALAHYTDTLCENLSSGEEIPRQISLREPSLDGGGLRGRLRWIVSFALVLWRIRGRSSDYFISTWPVFGYWDRALLAVLAPSRSTLVMHDPLPLVRAVGYGRLARWVSRRSNRCELLVHSEAAREAVARSRGADTATLLPHPFSRVVSKRSSMTKTAKVIRTMGQYKNDRDLGALAQIAGASDPAWKLEIIGRGWPHVPGWSVRDEFVPEAEFCRLIESADVLVIPYRHFFQSGVAVRALESSTAVVGPPVEGIVSLVGESSPWVVRGDWTLAVEAAANADPDLVVDLAKSLELEASTRWSRWLRQKLH